MATALIIRQRFLNLVMIDRDNLALISRIKWLVRVENVVRGHLGAAASVISIYALRGGVKINGMAKKGSTSTGGDGLGPFYMPRR